MCGFAGFVDPGRGRGAEDLAAIAGAMADTLLGETGGRLRALGRTLSNIGTRDASPLGTRLPH